MGTDSARVFRDTNKEYEQFPGINGSTVEY